MTIPPGLAHLARVLPLILIPPSVVYGILNIISRDYLEIGIPEWLALVVSVFSLPIVLFVSALHTNYRNRREAAARGAVLAPLVKDKWPGGLSTLAAILRNFKSGYPGDMFAEWSELYGNTFRMNLLSEIRMFTTEPEYIKALLATQADDFEKGPVLYKQFHTLLGTGVFNSDGDMWKFHRTMTRPFFSKERISHFDVFERHADDAITQAKERLAQGYPIDFQDMVSRFTLDSATEFLFGKDVRSLSAGLPYPRSSPLANSPSFVNHPSNIFAHSFMEAQLLTALRVRRGPSWPLFEFWKDQVQPHRDVVNKFLNPILVEAVMKKRAARENGEVKVDSNDDKEVKDDATLLDHLVNYTEDHQILRDEILNIMLAGRDTTASTLTFAIYMLAEHPLIAQRLREEILIKVGSSRRPTYDDMRDMKYLRAFVNETIRLYPPVPFNSRTSRRATLWSSKTPGAKPFYVPAGVKALYGVFLMHRRTDLWGPDALEFDPDRFLDDRLQKYLTPNPFIFLPFNAGPRICLGQQFAYHETSFFLVRLLQNFSAFTLATDAQPASSRPPASWAKSSGTKGKEKVWLASHLTMYAKEGLWVRMKEASAVETV